MYKSGNICEQKGERHKKCTKKGRRGAGYFERTLSATGSGAIDIDIQTGEAGRGDRTKKEAFGSARSDFSP